MATKTDSKKKSKTKKIKPKLEPGENSIHVRGYRLLHKRIDFMYPKFRKLEQKLLVAGIPVPYEVYVCGMTYVSLIAGIVGLVIGIVIASLINVNPEAFKYVLPIGLAFAAFQATFGIMYIMPGFTASGRTKKITEEMPYFMGYMATLSSSGLVLEGIFKEISKEGTKEEIVRMCQTISRDVDMFGMDIVTALKRGIEVSPSELWKELLEGLVSTVQSGGNLSVYFTATAQVQMEEKKLILQKMTNNLGVVAEMYTILLVVFPLMSIIMLAIMALMTPNFMGFDTVTMMQLITYLLVPIFGIMLLVMMDGMVPKR